MINILLAIIPSIIIICFIYIYDKLEHEPVIEILKAFSLGCISVLLSLFITYIFNINTKHIDNIIIYSFVYISLIEELSKWILTYLFIRNNKNYDYLFDSIVYFSLVSIGFATVENIIYVISGGVGVALIRSITTVPSHAMFAIIAGYNYALYKKDKKKRYLIYSIIIPIIIHGIYDCLLLTENSILLFIYTLFVITLYIISFRYLRNLESIDKKISK